MKTRKKFIVTGAGGFIGANIIEKLLREDQEIHVLWKETTNPWRLKNFKKKIHIHSVNFLKTTLLKKTVELINPQIIIHLAAHGAYSRQTDIKKIIQTNILGTINLLTATKNIPYEAFINTGTSSEYGYKNKPMKETDALMPTSFYAASKASATYLSSVFAQEFNKPILTVRPFSVYGPYEEKGRFIPTIITALQTDQPIMLTSGAVRRDFIYVEDFVNGVLALTQKAGIFKGQIFNIGSGKEYSNDEVVLTLFHVVKKSVLIKKGQFPKRKWDTTHWIADIHKMKKNIGWKPKYSLEKGLVKTYAWIKENRSFYL